MTDDRDRDVQDWFNRTVEELPRQPFTLAVMRQVRRRQRYLQLQRYAALLVAFCGVYLLRPELIALLNMLAALPLTLIEVYGEQWPLLVVMTMGLAWWLLKQARDPGFTQRLLLRALQR